MHEGIEIVHQLTQMVFVMMVDVGPASEEEMLYWYENETDSSVMCEYIEKFKEIEDE